METSVCEARPAGAVPPGWAMGGLRPAWPSISIVTVCLNQAKTIERAMRSVLEQAGGVNEYIVVDGGSTDGTREIIARYADRLTSWVSDPDRGQTHALNKGFARATGDVVGWLNADDELLPGALQTVRRIFAREEADVVCGACRYEHASGEFAVRDVDARELAVLDVYDPVHQPSCFWRRSLHEAVGGLDEGLDFGMDWDLWLKLERAGATFALTDRELSVYHVSGNNKTVRGGARRNREMLRILRHYGAGRGRLLSEIGYHVLWPLKRLRRGRPEWLCRPLSDATRTALWITLGPFFGFDRVRRCTHPFS